MEEIRFKIATLKADSAAQIVLGRPVQSYLNSIKSACATGEKDSDGNAVYLFDTIDGTSNAAYADDEDAACINTVLNAIGYFNPGKFDELIDAAAAAGSIWSKACAAYDAAEKAASHAASIAVTTDTAAKAAAAAVKDGTGTKTAAEKAAKTAADAAKDAAAAKQAAEKAAAEKAAALPGKQAADKALADYMADVPAALDFDPFTKDHRRDIAAFIYRRDKAGKLDKPAAMRAAHDYVTAHYQEWIGYFSHYINEIPEERDLPRDSDGELVHSRKDWRDRIHKALANRSFKAGIGYKIDLRDGIRIKGTDEEIVAVKVKKS